MLKRDFCEKFTDVKLSLIVLNIKHDDYNIDDIKDSYKDLKLKNKDNQNWEKL